MGADELLERIFKERKFLIGRPPARVAAGDRRGDGRRAGGHGHRDPRRRRHHRVGRHAGAVRRAHAVRAVGRSQRGPRPRQRHRDRLRWCHLGDITPDQFRALAAIQREFAVDVRVTNRQNFVLRGVTEEQLPEVHGRLAEIGMAEPGAELARDVVSCPGADTCNLAVTQSRGLAADIGDALEEAGLAEVGGVRINISGCTNWCGQHHIADIGFLGLERRAHGRAAPGYQMLLGGHVGNSRSSSARRPPRSRPSPRRKPSCAWSRGSAGAPGRRDVLVVARAIRRRQGGRRDVHRPRPVPLPRRSPRVLHRLRRDRPLRGRSRRLGVRDVTARRLHGESDPAGASSSDIPISASWRRLGRAGEQARVGRAQVGVGTLRHRRRAGRVVSGLRARRLATHAVPEIEVVFLDTQYHFAETLWYVERIRERYDLNLTVMSRSRTARRPLADRPRRVLRHAQGRAPRPRPPRAVGLGHRLVSPGNPQIRFHSAWMPYSLHHFRS